MKRLLHVNANSLQSQIFQAYRWCMFSTQKTKSPIRLQTFILSYIHQNISLCAESINGFTWPAVHIAPLPLASFHLWSAMLYPQHPLGNVVLKRMKKEETNRVVLINCITSISAAMHKAYWLDRHWWYLDHIGPLLVRPDDTGLPMPFDITHTSRHTHTQDMAELFF